MEENAMKCLMELCEKEPKLRLPKSFYSRAKSIATNCNKTGEALKYQGFLCGVDCCREPIQAKEACDNGDTRIDVPVWFGDHESAEKARRIISVVGSEPHDTNKKFNIAECGEKPDRYVFGCPFGAELWNEDVNGRYSESLGFCLHVKGIFLHLTDVVKEYSVTPKGKAIQEFVG